MGDARLSLAWGKAPRRRSAPVSPKAAQYVIAVERCKSREACYYGRAARLETA